MDGRSECNSVHQLESTSRRRRRATYITSVLSIDDDFYKSLWG